MKTIIAGANPWKLIFAVIIIALSLTMGGQARAADWSDEHFSCGIDVLRTGGAWYDFMSWGLWTELRATVSQTGGEADMKAAYMCMIVGTGPKYICQADPNYFLSVSRAEKEVSVQLKAGVSKREACETIFKAAGFKWWQKSRH